ncbi:MAG TPA: radical SAM protein [Candidatus Lokiarchaeia archaeon]|nr:radical SAM protein [Candidatus Lokiarchaeia archaeon]
MQDVVNIGQQFTGFIGQFLKMGIASIPIGVNFDITYNCNLRCEHCYYWKSINALGIKNRELSDDQWLDVFRYYKKLGVKNVSLTGGEPTLRMNIIQRAHDSFPQVQTATNGIIRIPEKIQPRGIWLSIDGPEEIHNKIRGSKSCFRKLQENYQDDKRVSVSSTISTTNYKYIDDIVKVVQAMNIKGVFFMIYSGTRDNPLYPTGKIYARIMKDLTRVIKEYPDTVLITEDILQAYHNKDFVKKCPFLGKHPGVISFYADMTRKRCVMGDNVDCSTCSCIVPVGAYVLQHNLANLENYFKIQRILY